MANIILSATGCQNQSQNRIFGICDEPDPNKDPAFLDEAHGEDWIAIVNNEQRNIVTFTAIDHCIELNRKDGKGDKKCDGVLSFESTIIFVELKDRDPYGTLWVTIGESQLKRTILHFEETDEAKNYTSKKAYIANIQHPKFRSSQMRRMDQFLKDTGYVLRIENRITL